ncbi:uncharacterized protein LOC135085285 isoform X3 [Ostrinia nubilalis]|uniref:uncharacterized protein LOC135085285 isoform X3 n=1 Tax=Ostrinia nubilalis TaxID=29057 RepID=UPI0030823C21
MAGLLCRICLARDTRMCTMYNTPLEVLYQKITKIPLKTKDGRPHVVCYVCYHLLSKCHKFIESAVKTDKVLQRLCSSGIQLTEQHIAAIDKAFLLTPLTKSRVINVNAISDSDGVSIEVAEVKREIEEDKPIYYEVEVVKDKADSLGFDGINNTEHSSKQYACTICGHCLLTKAEARKHYKWHGTSEEPYLDCLNYLFALSDNGSGGDAMATSITKQ